MKISVSVSTDDVAYLDAYARERGERSRSAVVHKAIGALRAAALDGAYEDAWEEWTASGEAAAWEPTTGDGVT
jgi:hypothetical protein